MAVSFYVVPYIPGVDPKRTGYKWPKYFPYPLPTPRTYDFLCCPLGLKHVAIVLVWGVPSDIDATLQAATDAYCLPNNLDANIPAGVLSVISTKIETNYNIPMDSFTTANTYRDLIRFVWKVASFATRFKAGWTIDLFDNGGLSTKYSALPQNVKTKLGEAANHFNLNTQGITGNSTLRQILNSVISQIDLTKFPMVGGII